MGTGEEERKGFSLIILRGARGGKLARNCERGSGAFAKSGSLDKREHDRMNCALHGCDAASFDAVGTPPARPSALPPIRRNYPAEQPTKQLGTITTRWRYSRPHAQT